MTSDAEFVCVLGLGHINASAALNARHVSVGSTSWRPRSADARVARSHCQAGKVSSAWKPALIQGAVGGQRGDHGAEAERQLPTPANWCCRPEPISAAREFDARNPSLNAESDRPYLGCSSNGQESSRLASWHLLEVAEGGDAEGGQRFAMCSQCDQGGVGGG